jgi:hypothetical protein
MKLPWTQPIYTRLGVVCSKHKYGAAIRSQRTHHKDFWWTRTNVESNEFGRATMASCKSSGMMNDMYKEKESDAQENKQSGILELRNLDVMLGSGLRAVENGIQQPPRRWAELGYRRNPNSGPRVRLGQHGSWDPGFIWAFRCGRSRTSRIRRRLQSPGRSRLETEGGGAAGSTCRWQQRRRQRWKTGLAGRPDIYIGRKTLHLHII